MFTGLIEAVGTVWSVEKSDRTLIRIEAPLLVAVTSDPLVLGESVAVNGVCLTVERLVPGGFVAAAMPVTMERTNLAALRSGARVNLERALRVGGRLGGHLVTGHVDGTGRVVGVVPSNGARLVTVTVPKALGAGMVPRGSAALDGVSLTIAELRMTGDGVRFTVSLVGHTQGATTLADLRPGSVVNIETDILMKYVSKAVGANAGLTEGSLGMLGLPCLP